MQKTAKTITKFLGSPIFFGLTLLMFLASSIWIALSSRFPMAFDEGYHLGIIKIYAHRLSPFFATQPPGPATYGVLTRDPSYLYHYLMSFPYRLVSVWTTSEMAHVLVLRLIDIVFFAIGLILLRALLRKTQASHALINLSLLFFILTPVVLQLAGQINYDDLLIPLTALALLLTINFVEKLKADHKFSLGTFVALITVCCLTSLVKYPFLPIFAAIVVYLMFELIRYETTHKHVVLKSINISWRKTTELKKAVLVVVALASLGLFINTYGVNIVQYHNPIPQCGQVLGPARCATYPPWARNYADALYNTGVDANPLRFTASWFQGMFTRLFFVINSSGPPSSNANHIAPVMAITALVIGGFGIIFCFIFGKRLLKRDPALSFLLFVTLAYCAALWGRNYHDFLHLGQIVAINGRYLIPVMLPVYLLVALSYQELLGRRLLAEGLLLVVVLLLFLQGGGVLSYLYYSNADWYWPHDTFITSANKHLRQIIRPFVILR